MFTISKRLVADIDKVAVSGQRGSGLVVNSELGFPLVVLVVSVGIAALCQFYETSTARWLSWFCFWFSWLMIVEVVSALFKLGEATLASHLKGTESSES